MKDIYSGNLNDIELTEIRNKQKTQTGFPVWVVRVYNENDEDVTYELFFSMNGRDKYINMIEDEFELFTDVEMKFVKDVKNVSYSVE